ncbi:UNVERIFIED_ORG: hypothetical protein J2Y77_003758 [Pseudomonas lini]|uniref:Uncharacterized protein n=1 Tax=Pseudomonas viciae TaxID=2505979 RepID=A0A4P7PMT7_9PSED|nr:hypothetical protein [Pseudomonas viciae]QBZ91693.1 hypothetical protein EPZ47_24325 [Pseudomonas viciae]UZE85508.1 hypothetical protein LOY66_23550 [Pseudomonas viciae]WGO92469.1 hypothetical protein QCD61_22625 [Pseudomonas viciae]
MSRAISHSSDPLIAIFEIFRNIMKDGTALNMMALAILAFINGELGRLDVFLPLLAKKIGATTQKTDECRVKKKLARGRGDLLAPWNWRSGGVSWMTGSSSIEAPDQGAI